MAHTLSFFTSIYSFFLTVATQYQTELKNAMKIAPAKKQMKSAYQFPTGKAKGSRFIISTQEFEALSEELFFFSINNSCT